MNINTEKYELVIEPSKSLFNLRLKDIWAYRELLYFLIWRDVKVKYKQSLLGVGWAVFQPIMMMVVITLVFGKLAKMPSGGIPYPVYSLCGIVIWNYFANSVSGGSDSIIRNSNLITKVYFPRLIIPLAAIGRGLVDFFIALIILFLIILYFGINLSLNILFIPIFILLTFLSASAISLWTSAISVKYRDLQYAIPFLIKILFWLSPVAYGAEAIPKRFSFLYSINPMYVVIEGFRWSLIGTPFPSINIMFISLFMVVLFFISGLIYFKNMERGFADII